MPEETVNSEVVDNGLQETGRATSENSLEMVMAQLEQSDPTIFNKLSPAHIDKILDQRSTIIEKVHTDRKDERWDNKFYLIVVLGFTIIVLGFVGWKLPEYFSEAISALLGGTGGIGVGFGLARKK
jgi:hypothetical protein